MFKSAQISKRLLATALTIGLCVFTLDADKISNKPSKFLSSLTHAIHIQHANAGTILGDNQEETIRFLYWLINGPPSTGYPTGFDGPEDGLLGMIRQITGPTALGLGLSSNGISSCADVPATGSADLTEDSGTFSMYFKTPSKTIPTGYTGAGATFSKHVTVQFEGVTFMNIEFECDTNVGWLRFFDNQQYATPTTARHIEVYWDTEDADATKMELYMYYENGLSSGQGNEYFIAKMETEPSNLFKIWITRGVDFTATASDNGFRAAVYGSPGDDIVNAYMLYSPGSGNGITDTTTNFTDNSDVNNVGDLQCIDFNDGGSATEDVSGGCASLTLTTAGAPIIAGGGDFSINWVTSSMKANMSAVTDP